MVSWGIIALAVIVLAVFGFKAVEKKRDGNGALVYPLWRCNLMLLWLAFFALCIVIVGTASLPKFIGLALHNAQSEATITGIDREQRCLNTYKYKVGAAFFTDTENFCGLRVGDTITAYYNTSDPGSSSLYSPGESLRDELNAILLISAILGAFMVAWLRATHIIAKKLRP